MKMKAKSNFIIRTAFLFSLSALAILVVVALPRLAHAQGSIEVDTGTTSGLTGTVSVAGEGTSRTCRPSNGRCVVSSLRPGTYTVTYSSPGQPRQRRTVRVESRRVRVSLASSRGNSRIAGRTTRSTRSGRSSTRSSSGSATTQQSTLSTTHSTPTTGTRRYLGSGKRMAIQGTATTQRGTPVRGTVEVHFNGDIVGYANVVTGRYTIYDLPRGSYRVTLNSPGGEAVGRTVSVGSSTVVVNLVLQSSSSSSSGGVSGMRTTATVLDGAADLSSGRRLAVQGTATTLRGTPAAGVIEVRRGGSLVGRVRVITGRYTIYDLTAGRHELTFRPTSGQAMVRVVSVGTAPVNANFVAR